MPEPPIDHSEALPVEDQELEQWLREAYEGPAMPASILQRVQSELAQEAVSASTVAVATSSNTPSVKRRHLQGRWLVMAAVSLVLLVGVVWRGPTSSAWAAMVDALEQRGVVQLTGPQAERWLALNEGLLGERTSEVTRLIDTQRQIVLERLDSEVVIRRSRWVKSETTSDRDRLVLGLFLGTSTAMQTTDLVLREESFDPDQEPSASPSLRSTWSSDRGSPIELTLSLDRDSQVPLDVQVRQAGSALPLQYLSYAEADITQFVAADFPPSVPVIDVPETALNSGTVLTQADTTPKTADVSTSPGLGLNVRPVFTQDGKDVGPLAGPAASWPRAAVVSRTRSEVVQEIDRILAGHWQDQQVEPAPLADDEELLRRVYLDLIGRTPTVYEIRTYLADRSPERYEQRVDQLLNSADHYSHLATIWRTFLIPDGIDLTAFGGVEAFDRWLAERFAKQRSYAQIVQELLQAEGRLSRSGPLLFYSATKLNPDELAARTARVFLGMRLECAQCHDHPFEPWTQQDFWGLAAHFAQISRPQANLQAVSTVMQVRDVERGEVKLPDTDSVVSPSLLNGAQGDASLADKARRVQLAAWITRPENPYFARATANRLWDLLFGQGIVNPVDDFGTQHPPRSPELLEVLASKLIEEDFDLQELLHAIALSRAYRLSSGAGTADDQRLAWFGQMSVKALSAEQMYDCITVATLLDSNSDNAFQLNRFDNVQREQFLQEFRTLSGRRTEYQGGIPQALTLMNGTLIENATGLTSSGLLKSLEAPFFTNRQRIEVLYLATLSRRPRPQEWEHLVQFMPENATGAVLQEGLADILWALLNSAEFTLNH